MKSKSADLEPETISSLLPQGSGHQFVIYGDCCSGVPGGRSETIFASVNKIISRLSHGPEFCIFVGDEIQGLTHDEAVLKSQWQHWIDVEMQWVRQLSLPLYNVTGNHTVYSAMSERVFQDVHARLPQNGPADQKFLSYYVRHGDLLLVFINTMHRGLGGEGHVETQWLESTLRKNSDARWSFVMGHHPAFPVNGYAGDYQRTIGSEYVERFWQLLKEHNVTAYFCSHILAFDVQVHSGVLQITTGGAGTPHLMPQDHEYYHLVQVSIDGGGLRYQVLDVSGAIREKLHWPVSLTPSRQWLRLEEAEGNPSFDDVSENTESRIAVYRFQGESTPSQSVGRQTLLALSRDGGSGGSLWIGLTGRNQRLTVQIQPWRNRSPHTWLGPEVSRGKKFDLQLAFHGDMGPGGVMWRGRDGDPWQSLRAASPWGPEMLFSPPGSVHEFSIVASEDAPFEGTDLVATTYV